MCFLGLVTPLNSFIFIAYGAAFIAAGYSIASKIGTKEIEEEVTAEEEQAEEIRRPENVVSLCLPF